MESSSDSSEKRYGYGVRHIQMICIGLAMVALFIARGSLGVAVLAMTDVKRKDDPDITVYDWDKKIQSYILSSFFWGYTAMQVPAGILSKRYGGKPTLLFSLVANAVICSLLPTLVKIGGWQIVCACRVVMGLTQACLFPASHTLLGKWLPAHESTSYTGIVYGGCQIGIIIAMPVSGLLAETKMGWTLIFYTVSAIMFVTAALFAFFSASSPKEHRMMTNEERKYIEKGLNTGGAKNLRTPWREIFTTKGLWGNMITHFGCATAYVLFFVDMPTYFERGLQISLKNSAFLSALPFIGMLLGNIVAAISSEKLTNMGYLSIGASRKVFNSLANVGMAIGLIVLAYCGPNQKFLAISALISAHTLYGFISAGFMMVYLDLSPNYAGVMLSITHFVANCGNIATPIVTSFILRNDPTDLSRWRIMFLLTAATSFITNAAFVFLASSERQKWDDPKYFEKKKADAEEIKPALELSGSEKIPK